MPILGLLDRFRVCSGLTGPSSTKRGKKVPAAVPADGEDADEAAGGRRVAGKHDSDSPPRRGLGGTPR